MSMKKLYFSDQQGPEAYQRKKNRDVKIKTDYWDLGFPPGSIKHD